MVVKCEFGVGDVRTIFDLTEDEAEAFLAKEEKHIAEAMAEAGWEAIHTLGTMVGLEEHEEQP